MLEFMFAKIIETKTEHDLLTPTKNHPKLTTNHNYSYYSVIFTKTHHDLVASTKYLQLTTAT